MATFYNLWLQHKVWSFGYFCDSQQAAKNKPPKIWQRFLRISLDAFLEMDDATIKNNLEKKRNEL